jgi:hypothetical protein
MVELQQLCDKVGFIVFCWCYYWVLLSFVDVIIGFYCYMCVVELQQLCDKVRACACILFLFIFIYYFHFYFFKFYLLFIIFLFYLYVHHHTPTFPGSLLRLSPRYEDHRG